MKLTIPFLLFFDIITLTVILYGGSMRFNQYSYINFPKENVLSELKKCGFDLQNTANHKDSLETFLRRFFFTYQDTNYPLSILAADKKQTC